MKPANGNLFRDETFESLQGQLVGLRQRVYRAWREFGPGTTREVSRRCGIDLLTFRPRTTELMQLGLVVVDEGPGGEATSPNPLPQRRGNEEGTGANGHEGVYRARTMVEWMGFVAEERAKAVDRQLKLI